MQIQTKLIVVPDVGNDLFTLSRPYGISRGPITEPIRLQIETIKELLSQYNEPRIFEVIIDENKTRFLNGKKVYAYTEPVQLTLENYLKPYNEIAGIEKNNEPKAVVEEKPVELIEEVVEVIEEEPSSVEEIAEDAVTDEKETKKKTKKNKDVK